MKRSTPCACPECTQVTRIARDSRELPGSSTYRLLLAFTTCKRTGKAYRSALRPFLVGDAEAKRQLDAESVEDESTDDGSSVPSQQTAGPMSPSFLVTGVTIPAYDDLLAWRCIPVTDYPAIIRQLYTMHSVERNFHPLPRYHRCKTVFTSIAHEYWVDGIWVNNPEDPNRWPSPSTFIHWLWKPFDAPFRAKMSATTMIRELFYAHVVTAADVPRKPAPALSVLWSNFLLKYTPIIDALVWQAYLRLFTTPRSQQQPSSTGRLQATFDASIQAWRRLPENAGWIKFQEDFLRLLAEEVGEGWDNNRDAGSDKHEGYEAIMQGNEIPAGSVIPLGFMRAMVMLSKQYDVYASEVAIFDADLHVIGCVDLILVDRVTGELLLADYKNCADQDLRVAGNPKGFGTHPFTCRTPDTKFNHYRLQLSIYRNVLNRLYFPGRFVNKLLLLNFRPKEPDAFYTYEMEPLDLTTLWALCPWSHEDPRHKQFPMAATLVAPIPDDDPRTKGSTRSIRLPRDVTTLPLDVVWSGGKYAKLPYPTVPDSEWKHPTRTWFGEPTPDIAASYEEYLLNNAILLNKLPELESKRIACWCWENGKNRCNGEVLVKWANLLANGAFTLPVLGTTPDANEKPEKDFFNRSREVKQARARTAAKAQAAKDGNVMAVKDSGF